MNSGQCDDGNPCTTDSCDATGLCLHVPAGCDEDLDNDGDVDADDLGLMGDCMSGPENVVAPGCEGAILDADSDVDMLEYLQMQAAATNRNN